MSFLVRAKCFMLVSWAFWISGKLWSGPNELTSVDNVKYFNN